MGLIESSLALPDESMAIDDSHESSTPSKSVSALIKPKAAVTLVTDSIQNKKIFKDSSFSVKVQSEIAKQAVSQNINLLNIIDSNRDGLVAICEDQEVNFYTGSSFSED